MMTTSFPVTCPQCGYRIMKTLGELEAVDDFRCPDCGLLIKVEGLRETLQEHRQVIDKLRRNMRRMFPKK